MEICFWVSVVQITNRTRTEYRCASGVQHHRQAQISTQASSNFKACADLPILRGTRRSDYLITGRARGTRRGGEEASSPYLSSYVLDISSFAPKKSYDCYDGGLLFLRASKYGQTLPGTDQGRWGEGGINVRSCYTGSSHKFEDAQKQTPTQVPNHHKFYIMALWHCSEPTCTWKVAAYTLLPGDHCSLLSLSGCQSDGMLRN